MTARAKKAAVTSYTIVGGTQESSVEVNGERWRFMRPRGDGVGRLVLTKRGGRDLMLPDTDDDARLMIAAPAMYKALYDLIAEMQQDGSIVEDDGRPYRGHRPGCSCSICVSLVALAIAEGPGRCIVISDASPLAGLPPGEYWSMGAMVRLQDDGKLFNPATGYMAGSSAIILACANHLAGLGLAGLNELSQMFFYNPLRLIGVSPKQVRAEKRILFDAKEHRVFQE